MADLTGVYEDTAAVACLEKAGADNAGGEARQAGELNTQALTMLSRSIACASLVSELQLRQAGQQSQDGFQASHRPLS